MLRFKYFGILFFLVLFGCKIPLELSEISWVLGKWQVNGSNSFEEWDRVNDNLYRGKGYEIRKNRIDR